VNQPASNAPEPNSQAIPDFLTGGGELGARMRSFAWETTPLGPPASWPQSLTIAVRIMLASRQPIWIGWGNDLHYLYNDAYKSIMGGKHPWALGRPAREVWHEIWDEIGPMLATALRGDQGTYVESQFLIMERMATPRRPTTPFPTARFPTTMEPSAASSAPTATIRSESSANVNWRCCATWRLMRVMRAPGKKRASAVPRHSRANRSISRSQ